MPDQSHERYESIFADVEAPFAFLDLDAMWRNAGAMLDRARGKPVRVASKSLRCRAVIDSITARQRRLLLATRTGLPAARSSIAPALAHIASRSTKANGASTSAKIDS